MLPKIARPFSAALTALMILTGAVGGIAGLISRTPAADTSDAAYTAATTPRNTATAIPATNTAGATATVTLTPAPTDTATAPPTAPSQVKLTGAALQVAGTQIVNAQGHPVTLVGVNHSDLEYSCAGDGHFTAADFAAMRAWGANVVRIPVSSEFWANHANTCPQYRSVVQGAISLALNAGLYVIVDLQWNAPFDTANDRVHGGVQCPLPDANQDVAFWRDMAALYRNDARVIFDLFGEPHDIGFNTWYYGGTLSSGCYIIQSGGAVQETGSYQAIGMGKLALLVRGLAPQTILMLGGISWGYDLSGVAPNYVVPDANIIYDTHPFDYGGKQPGNWQHDFGAFAQSHAVIVGEFGSYHCGTSYIASAISYFNAHHIPWLAWTWDVGGCSRPSLIANWSGTPSAPYGQYIHDAMLRAAGR